MTESGRLDSLQRRFEQAPGGQAVITLFVVVVLFALAITLLPGGSNLHQRLVPRTQPVLNALGLDQNWGVFSPNPRQQVLEIEGRVQHADGQTTVWHLPEGDPFVGALWDYRWKKFVEYVNAPEYQQFWRPTAELIAREETRGGKPPVEVTLVRRTKPIQPPGRTPRYGPAQEATFYTYRPGAQEGQR